MRGKLFSLLMAAGVVAGIATSASARTMTVTPNKTANVVTSVSLAFGDDDTKDYALYVAYGAADAGSDISCWEKSEKVADIAAGTTSYSYAKMPYGWGFRYHAMRFFLFDPTADKPFDKQLEYLKGDGNNYVLTGFTPTGISAIEVDFKGTSADGTSIYCARNGTVGVPFDLFAENNMLRFDYFGYANGGVSLGHVRNDGKRHRVRGDRMGIYLDGRLASSLSCPMSSAAAGTQVVLLGLHTDLNVTAASKYTIYGFKGWTNASDSVSLAIDLVPCVKDGVVCFYDRVKGACLANSGNGAFVAGPEVPYRGKSASVTSSAIADFSTLAVTAALSSSGATVSFPSLPAACQLVAAYGVKDGGTALEGWESVVKVSTLEAGATSYEVSALAEGWGDRYHFVRFFLVDESNRTFDKQVAYIQGQGAQYIETDFVPTGRAGIEADFELTVAENQAICCASGAGYVSPYLVLFYNNNTIRWDYLAYNPNVTDPVSRGRHSLRVDANRLFVDEEEMETIADVNGAAAGSRLVLFAKHSGLVDGWNSYGKHRLYSFKAWSNRALKDMNNYCEAADLDLVPCVKDGVAGLFNRVDGQFFGGKGTGAFLTGADAVYIDAARLGASEPLYAANGRTIAAKRYSASGKTVRVELTFGPAQSDYRLYAAFAATDCGDDIDAWTLKQAVTTIAAADSGYSFTDFPEGWGTTYKFVRFFLVGDRAAMCPYDSRVEYLKANTKQSILTDFYPTGKSAVEFECDNNDISQRAAFCARDISGSKSFSVWIGGRFRFDYYNKGVMFYPSEEKTLASNLGRHTFRCEQGNLLLDGETVITHATETTATGYPMSIFSRHNALTNETPDGNFALYWFKAWQDPATSTQPALDLVPCVKNKEGCLYDRVGRKLLFNRTNTPFTLGAVLPDEEDLTAVCASSAVSSDPSGMVILFR